MPSPEFRTAAFVTVEENQDAFVVGLFASSCAPRVAASACLLLTPPRR